MATKKESLMFVVSKTLGRMNAVPYNKNHNSWLEIYANLQSPKTPKSISEKVPYRCVTGCMMKYEELSKSSLWGGVEVLKANVAL
ncbi:hypothetical protein TNCV_4875241 [Trichonephila clavipes]|nr:hypothetical protein TNCV_4875241 [Trichonephila clavipes]